MADLEFNKNDDKMRLLISEMKRKYAIVSLGGGNKKCSDFGLQELQDLRGVQDQLGLGPVVQDRGGLVRQSISVLGTSRA